VTAIAEATRIELPQWYAGFSYSRASSVGSDAPQGRFRGPLEVYHPEYGAAIVTFGAAGDPCVALFDGYLFDRSHLRAELGLRHDAPDVQIVAHAYDAWGADMFARLAGSYLLAVWDARQRRLLVGHDPLGRHPVFYANRPDAFWFGSNVLALAGSGKVSNRPNRMSLALAAVLQWPEAGDTFFEDIFRVRPGHYLEIGGGGAVRQRKYWDPLPDGNEEWLSEREVIEAFEPALFRAVTRCMELAPDGIMLSGGVDSVTIAALASRYRHAHGQPPIVAISGRADVPVHQEEQMQARAADALGMPQLVSRNSEWTPNGDDIAASLDAARDLPGPSRIYWVGTYMGFYRRAASHDLHVLLTGSGGDNWLAVADIHAADLIRRLKVLQLTRFIRVAAHTGGSSYTSAMKRLLWHGGVHPLVNTVAARLAPGRKASFHRQRVDAFVPDWVCVDGALRRDLVERMLGRRTPSLTASGKAPQNYYKHSLQTVANPHLYYEFETAFHVDSMCGLRLLSPYHDHDLVSFFTRIPPPVLVHGNKYKGLLRPLVEKYLPGLGFGEQRKDYPKPALDLDLRNLRNGVIAAWPSFRFSALAQIGLVDPARAAREYERAPTHTSGALVRMFALMSAERWVSARTL
jgi:asparagine synthetase B (glutamine-hydrolysing)